MKPAYKILKYIFLFCLILLIVELSLTAASQLNKRSYLRTSKEIDINLSRGTCKLVKLLRLHIVNKARGIGVYKICVFGKCLAKCAALQII